MKKITAIISALLIISMLVSCSVRQGNGPVDKESAAMTSSVMSSSDISSLTSAVSRAVSSAAIAGETADEPDSRLPQRIIAQDDISPEAKQTLSLASELCAASGIRGFSPALLFGEEISNGDIVCETKSRLGDEDYKIKITDENIFLYFSDTGRRNGLLYGMQHILKMLIKSKGSLPEPCDIGFSPDTAERTLMLDCARKCWSPGWIKSLIAEMSWMGFNTLELHLTEEQGIRADIWRDKDGNAVPDCNGNDFSFICGGTVVSWNKNYPENVNAKYPRDDIIDIINCAKKFHIDIIPSVDLPGHSTNLIKRCSDRLDSGTLSFSYGGKTYTSDENTIFSAQGSNYQTIDISAEFAGNLALAVTEAYASFFRNYGCNKFNICSDEVTVNDPDWETYARENGGSTMFDGFVIYMNSVCEMLKNMGYTVRAFNDYLFSRKSNIEIDPDLEVCYWNEPDTYYGSAADLRSNGRIMYNCVSSSCYYVLRQSKSGEDARSGSCRSWSFQHSTAERIYSGCEGKCRFKNCREYGGWNPSKMWEFSSVIKTKITGKSLGGGYFLIWGDWAGWDSESNIVRRNDDLNVIDRMWASIAKMNDFDCEKNQSYSAFKNSVSAVRFSPLADF